MRQKSSAVTNKNNFVVLMLVFSPVLSNYAFLSQFGIGDLLVVLTLPWLFLSLKLSLINTAKILAALIVVLLSFIFLGSGDVYFGFYRSSFYFILFFIVISQKKIILINFLKIYGYVCIVASGALILQWLAYFVFGVNLIFQLPFEHYEPDTLNVIDHVFRAGGFFREPSYFSLYVMPYILYASFQRKHSVLIVMLIAGVMSTSSMMFFIILVVSYIYLNGVTSKYLSIIVFGVILIFGGYGLLNLSDDFIFIERVRAIFMDGGTLKDRFLPFFEIFGIENVMFASVEGLYLYLNANLWFNSAASIAVYFGIIGLILIVVSLYRLGLLFGGIFFLCIFLTHIMSGPFGYFIVIALLEIRYQTYYSLQNCRVN